MAAVAVPVVRVGRDSALPQSDSGYKHQAGSPPQQARPGPAGGWGYERAALPGTPSRVPGAKGFAEEPIGAVRS